MTYTRAQILEMSEIELKNEIAKKVGYNARIVEHPRWNDSTWYKLYLNNEPVCSTYCASEEIAFQNAPDYPWDIESVFQLEEKLPESKRGSYAGNLEIVLTQPRCNLTMFAMFHANATDRCRALLMTMEGAQ